MLKGIQLFGCSSGSISNFFRPFSGCGLSFVSSSTLSFSYSSSTSRSSPASFSPAISSPKCRSVRIFSGSSPRSESISDSASSSSSSSSSSLSGPAQPASSAVVQSAGNVRNVNFCQWCGGPAKHSIPDGEEKLRAICTVCGKITYQNPKMVVGCLIEHDNKILLCKRKIQPSYGLWTLPAGYMEIGESAAEGAIRETWEEACAEVQVLSPFAQLDIPLIGQTYIIFLAKLKNPHFSPGPESSECRLFSLDDIPFDSLAFSSMLVTLTLYMEDVKTGRIKFHYGTINKRPGTTPSDIHAYTLDYHLLS